MAEETSSRRTLLSNLGGVAASLLLHGCVLLALRWAGTLPDVGFEIELPAEVEFGVDEHGALPSAPTPVVAPPAPTPASVEPAGAPAPSDPGPTPAPPKPKPKPKEPKPSADAGVADETTAHDAGHESGGNKEPALAAFAPKGAQLALRVDLDRLRSSPLAEPTRGLLQAIPDFQLILDGSGIDPIDTLSRLFIASPNLKRDSIVIAGKYVGGRDVATRAVAQLAAARGKEVAWKTRGGIPIAPWENADSTARVLALLGPQLFAIARADDLPRILAVAHALATRAADARHAKLDDTEALLAMNEGELVVFSVENAKAFVRGKTDYVPDRVEISISLIDDGANIEVHTHAVYASAERADKAHAFWQDAQERFARHPLVALSGLGAPLRATTLEASAESLDARTKLSVDDARRILEFARDALTTRPTTRRLEPSAPSPNP